MNDATGYPRLIEPNWMLDLERGRGQVAYAYGAAAAFGLMGMAEAIRQSVNEECAACLPGDGPPAEHIFRGQCLEERTRCHVCNAPFDPRRGGNLAGLPWWFCSRGCATYHVDSK